MKELFLFLFLGLFLVGCARHNIIISEPPMNTWINGSPICTQDNGFCAGQEAQGNGSADYMAKWVNGTHVAASTLIYEDTGANSIGIGTESPEAKLDVYDDQDSGTNVGTLNNIQAATVFSGGTDADTFRALFSYAYLQTGSALTNFEGSRLSLLNQGSVTNAYGQLGSVTNLGTISNWYAVYADEPTNIGGGTTTNVYGVYIEDMDSGSGNNYGVYSLGGENYLEAGSTTQTILTLQGAPSQSANLQTWQDSTGDVLLEVQNDGELYVHNSNRVFFTNTTGGTSKYMYIEMDAANRGWLQTKDAPLYIRAPESAIYIASSNFEQIFSTIWDMKYAGTTHLRVQQGVTIGNSLIGSYSQAGDGDLQVANKFSVGAAINNSHTAGILSDAASDTVLRVAGTASQTGDLQQWTDQYGNELGKINGTGTVFLQDVYAEMWIHNESNDDTVISVADTYYNVTESMNGGYMNGFTYSAGVLTAEYDGVYAVKYAGGFSGGANNEYHLAIGVNGVEMDNCHMSRKIGTGGDVGSAALTCITEIEAGDEITAMVENQAQTQDANFADLNLNLLRIGGTI